MVVYCQMSSHVLKKGVFNFYKLMCILKYVLNFCVNQFDIYFALNSTLHSRYFVKFPMYVHI